MLTTNSRNIKRTFPRSEKSTKDPSSSSTSSSPYAILTSDERELFSLLAQIDKLASSSQILDKFIKAAVKEMTEVKSNLINLTEGATINIESVPLKAGKLTEAKEAWDETDKKLKEVNDLKKDNKELKILFENYRKLLIVADENKYLVKNSLKKRARTEGASSIIPVQQQMSVAPSVVIREPEGAPHHSASELVTVWQPVKLIEKGWNVVMFLQSQHHRDVLKIKQAKADLDLIFSALKAQCDRLDTCQKVQKHLEDIKKQCEKLAEEKNEWERKINQLKQKLFAVDNEGRTFLHYAVLAGKPEDVFSLLKFGVNAWITDRAGHLAIMLALKAQNMDNEIINVLLAEQKNKVDAKGRTLLHYAVLAGIPMAVSRFLEGGVDPTIADQANNLPIELACKARIINQDMIDLLLAKQKDKATNTQNYVVLGIIKALASHCAKLLEELESNLANPDPIRLVQIISFLGGRKNEELDNIRLNKLLLPEEKVFLKDLMKKCFDEMFSALGQEQNIQAVSQTAIGHLANFKNIIFALDVDSQLKVAIYELAATYFYEAFIFEANKEKAVSSISSSCSPPSSPRRRRGIGMHLERENVPTIIAANMCDHIAKSEALIESEKERLKQAIISFCDVILKFFEPDISIKQQTSNKFKESSIPATNGAEVDELPKSPNWSLPSIPFPRVNQVTKRTRPPIPDRPIPDLPNKNASSDYAEVKGTPRVPIPKRPIPNVPSKDASSSSKADVKAKQLPPLPVLSASPATRFFPARTKSDAHLQPRVDEVKTSPLQANTHQNNNKSNTSGGIVRR